MKDKPFYYQDNRALHERKMNEAARLEISRRNIEFILEHQKDSAAELARYLRRCQAELGHVPAQSEILGGDLLDARALFAALNVRGDAGDHLAFVLGK